MKNTIYLHLDYDEDAVTAARFVAELQRQGIAFEAMTGIITSKGGASGAPGLVVTITGH